MNPTSRPEMTSSVSRRAFLAASAATAASAAMAGRTAFAQDAPAAEGPTYAERLGWDKGAKVVIFHSDDMGMCWEANEGTRISIEQGVVTSASTMMPCAWTPNWLKVLEAKPGFDNGVHLTFTSEFPEYRWHPVAGVNTVPSLVDGQGKFWKGVRDVVENANPDDIETEIRAQIAAAERIGLPITHMDSHMGTLFATPAFFERYMKVGIEKKIPILVSAIRGGRRAELAEFPEKVWEGGLPVVDGVVASTYGWKTLDEKKTNMVKTLRELQPGVTEIIVHCNVWTDNFNNISTSGSTRQADLDVTIDPEIKTILSEEGIVLSTWKELMERRQAVGKTA